MDLHIPKETQKAIDNLFLPDVQDWNVAFWSDSACFSAFAQASPDGLAVLKVYQLAAEEMTRRYMARGIPDEILQDNLLDFGIWCRSYLQKTGRPGVSEWNWLGMTLRGRLFRLGRLQFEPSVLTQPCGQYPAGTPVLEVHIPAEAPLDAVAVKQSLDRAPGFFRQYFNQEYALFHCHSWLLSPQLKQLLPADSRIMQFQALFEIVAWDKADRQAESRVFGKLEEDPAFYPEETSLQRALKGFILGGGCPGVGHGLRKIETSLAER